MVAADNNVTENHLLEARSKEPDTDGIQYKKPYKWAILQGLALQPEPSKDIYTIRLLTSCILQSNITYLALYQQCQ